MTDITELAQRMKAAAEKLDADQWQTRKGFSGIEVIVKGSLEKGTGCVSFQPVAAEIADTKTARAISLFNPANVLSLVEALEKAQQYSKERDAENQDLMLTVGRLRVESEEIESRTVTAAAADVLAERQRQVTTEGWTPEHDDKYEHGQLAGAASCYARHVNSRGWVFHSDPDNYRQEPESTNWPWHHDWWKPTNPRRDLVKAGALILAEIERLDRAAGIKWEAE
ncbi:ead/Ea22-like family protein [Raoultella planticola]